MQGEFFHRKVPSCPRQRRRKGRHHERMAYCQQWSAAIESSGLGYGHFSRSHAAMTGKSQAVQPRFRDAGVEAGHSAAFANVVHAFALDRRVVLAGGKGFGAGTLKVDGKIFAMISSSGYFVAKLPADRVDEFVRNGIGQRFDAGRGKQMKEWLALDGATGQWIDIAKEARLFVAAD